MFLDLRGIGKPLLLLESKVGSDHLDFMLSQIRWLQRVQLGVLLLDPVLTRLRRGDVMEARALDLLREHGSRVNYSAILLFLCQRGVVQLMVLGCTSSLAEARVKQ